MIKSELVQKLADENPHLFQRDIENIVNAILDEVGDAMARGDRVELRGFGAFSVKNRPARVGRNPRTGEQVDVGEKYVPQFKAGKEIRERLKFLNNVGLEYLTLARASGTLSGGESQRIRLASQIGSGLTGVLYVLDEPSIGLHQRDNAKLLESLKGLRDMGNTVLVVEHDEDAIRTADHVIDMGPGAGVHGGHIIAEGTPAEIMANKKSLTGKYLNGLENIPVPAVRRRAVHNRWLKVIGAKGNNLKNITAEIPLGTLTCITGVSGGGKSTLTIETLF